MRPINLSFTPADDSTTGFGSGFTGAGPFVTTTTSSGDGLAHQVTLTSTANLGSITITVTGTDADGKAQTEAITGPSNSTVAGSKYFGTVTGVSVSATLGSNTLSVGWKDVCVTRTIAMDYKANPFSVGFDVVVTGTINYTVQHTFANVFDSSVSPSSSYWFDNSTIASKTDNEDGNYAFNIMGMRLLINSLTSGATVKFDIIQGSVV